MAVVEKQVTRVEFVAELRALAAEAEDANYHDSHTVLVELADIVSDQAPASLEWFAVPDVVEECVRVFKVVG